MLIFGEPTTRGSTRNHKMWTVVLSRGYDEHFAWPIFDGTHLWVSAPFQAGSQLFLLFGGDSTRFERV